MIACICGAEFQPYRAHHRFCSTSCQQRAVSERRRRTPPAASCGTCRLPFQPAMKTQRFCSAACRREANRKQRNAAAKAWRKANRIRILEYKRRKHREHPEVVRARVKRYFAEHPEARARAQRKHRAAKRGAEGSHTDAEWLALCVAHAHCCLCCGHADVPLTRDHVVPLSKGGSDLIVNIQPLCKLCNSRKHNKVIDYRKVAAA